MIDGHTSQEPEGQAGDALHPDPFNACHEFVVVATVISLFVLLALTF